MKTIRDIINKVTDLNQTVEDNNGHTDDRLTSVLQYAKQQELDQALKEIEELLVECKPYHNRHIKVEHEKKLPSVNQSEWYFKGYNQAIDDYEKNIKTKIGGK